MRLERLAPALFVLVAFLIATPARGYCVGTEKRLEIVGIAEPDAFGSTWVTFRHNCITGFRWSFNGSSQLENVAGDQFDTLSRSISLACLTGPTTIAADDDANNLHDTLPVSPLDHTPTLELRTMRSPANPDTETGFQVTWKTPHTTSGVLNVWVVNLTDGQARPFLSGDLDNVEGESVVYSLPGSGVMVGWLTSCIGATKDYAVYGGERRCRDCNDNCDLSCRLHPIRTSSGNARFTDVDALPASFLPLQRTYDSRFSRDGWFGRGWVSLFDPIVLAFAGPEDSSAGSVAVLTEESDEVIFQKASGVYRQVFPSPGSKPATLTLAGDGTWRYTDADGRIVRAFNADGKIASYTERATGRAVEIAYSGGYPASVHDSWGNWTWNVTASTALHRITNISVDGQDWTYGYVNGTDLGQVTSPLGAWRTYEHASVGGSRVVTRIRDALGNEIERHDYDGFRATNSFGSGGDATSIEYELPGRKEGETVTRYTLRTGQVELHYLRQIGNEWRTVQISGGCTSCSSGDGTFVYDPATGNMLREQDARGYITQSAYYPSGRLQARTTNLKPRGCDPAAALDLCRLDPDTLAGVLTDPTGATVTTSYTYDAVWPEKPATISTTSVYTAPDRIETFFYHPISGQVTQQRVTGTTGITPSTRIETRTTSHAFYNGTEGAAFTPPASSFDPAWVPLPQPALLRKSSDGSRTDVVDVMKVVHYPIHSSVPARLRGRVAAVQNALGHVTRYEAYDAFGNATRVVDPNGVATEMTYDALGRLLTSTLKGVPGCNTTADPLCETDIVSTRGYFGAGPMASETRPEGGVTRYEYDEESRVRAVTRGPSSADQRERRETDYDPATGKKSAERVRGFEGGAWVTKTTETFAYDADGQLLSITHADGTSMSYVYDAAGRITEMRDENHGAPNTFYQYDAGGRLVRVEQILGSGRIATVYGYDVAGNLISVTDPNGNTTTYLYDDFGQLLRQISPVTGTTTYGYNLGGLLTSTTDANGAVTTRHYDALGRIFYASSVRNGQQENVSWGYDQWAGLGRLASMNDPSGFTAWYYTRAGQMRVEQRNIEGTLYTSQQYRFDRNGNPNVITYPSGRSFTYSYDYADRPVSITTPGATIVSSAAYLPFGPLRELVYGNGSVKTMTYDARYQVETNRWVNGATTLASYDYDHDPAGNITRMDDLVSAGFNRQFGYDDLHRLTTTVSGSMLWGTRPYTYDAMGNIKSTATGIPFTHQGTTPKIATFDEGSGPSAVTYDAAGNELSAGALTTTISPRNYVATLSNASFDYTFRYNGQGVRALTEESPKPPTGTTVKRHHFYTPDLRFLGRVDYTVTAGTTSLLRRIEPIWLGSLPVAQIDYNDPATLRYTFTDHLGAPILQTSTTGAVIWQVDREPYGRVWRIRAGTLSAQPLHLPGQEVATDREYYNVFRWYRGGWGRYTQADPIGLVDSTNLYLYAQTNPVRWSDHLGLYADPGGAFTRTCWRLLEEAGSPGSLARAGSRVLPWIWLITTLAPTPTAGPESDESPLRRRPVCRTCGAPGEEDDRDDRDDRCDGQLRSEEHLCRVFWPRKADERRACIQSARVRYAECRLYGHPHSRLSPTPWDDDPEHNLHRVN